MLPWRKTRDGKTGIAMNASSRNFDIVYEERDISAASNSRCSIIRKNVSSTRSVRYVRSAPPTPTRPSANAAVRSESQQASVTGIFGTSPPPRTRRLVPPRVDRDVDGAVPVFVANLARDQTQRLLRLFQGDFVRRHRFEIDGPGLHQVEGHLDRLEAVPAHAPQLDGFTNNGIEIEAVDGLALEGGGQQFPVACFEDIQTAVDHLGRTTRGAVQDEVGTLAVGDLSDLVAHRLSVDHDRVVGTQALGHLEAMLVARKSGADDGLCARRFRRDDARESLLPRPLDHYRLPGTGAAVEVRPLKAVPQGERHRSQTRRYPLGDLVQDGSRMNIRELAISAPQPRPDGRLRRAVAQPVRAFVVRQLARAVLTRTAIVAMPAGQILLKRDIIAFFDAPPLRRQLAELLDDPDVLVTEDARDLARVGVHRNIGAANPGP